MYLCFFLIISPWKRAGISYEQTRIPFTQWYFVPSLVEISSVVLEKKIFTFVNVFSLFLNDLTLEKGGALHLKKLESPLPKDALCQVWLKLARWFWRRKFSNFDVLLLLLNYLPLEKGRGPSFEQTWILYPRMLCAKLRWNWPSGSIWRRRLQKIWENRIKARFYNVIIQDIAVHGTNNKKK